MRVHWTNKALNDLLSIYECIEQSSPGYADQTVDRLTRRTEQIEVFPESGRAVLEYERDDIRELIEQPYRVIYQIGGEQSAIAFRPFRRAGRGQPARLASGRAHEEDATPAASNAASTSACASSFSASTCSSPLKLSA